MLGLNSEWYHQQSISQSFGNDELYQKYENASEVQTHITQDEQFSQYFEKKYFNNKDYFKLNQLDVD